MQPVTHPALKTPALRHGGLDVVFPQHLVSPSPGHRIAPPFVATRSEPKSRPANPKSIVLQEGQQPPSPPLMALPTPPERTGRFISAFAPLLRSGRKLYCVDGGNGFNPYRLAQTLRTEGLDPQFVLERVFVSRAYTCHQLLGAIENMMPPLLDCTPRPAVALLGVDHLFMDEDIPLFERRHIFNNIINYTAALHRRGLTSVITFESERSSPWARHLARSATILNDPARAVEYLLPRPSHELSVQLTVT